ncbi:MAG: type II toxin-antitoxin system VapC family toxin [Anaerolineae bacterium]|nr:type II toxin-antitoxin system VapC family toxin [Anaerolineae bacterium]MCI0610487.1 type II toxin-antitoxin system VapC family toxin [Anaerolineae bacterium]
MFAEEEFSEKVQRLFAKLAEDPQTEIHVPDLFYIECANILLKYTHRYKRPQEDSLEDLKDLNNLALIITSTSELIEDAVQLAGEKNLTAYDACYAVLARKLKLPLVTADAPLAKAIDWAIWIGDFEF